MNADLFETFLRHSVSKAREEERSNPRILPEAAIARLQELLPAYRPGPAPYAVGDVVTPRRDSTLRGAGDPHIVVDVLRAEDVEYRFDQGEACSTHYGQLLNMRVIHLTGDHVMAHWVESADFEIYMEPTSA